MEFYIIVTLFVFLVHIGIDATSLSTGKGFVHRGVSAGNLVKSLSIYLGLFIYGCYVMIQG